MSVPPLSDLDWAAWLAALLLPSPLSLLKGRNRLSFDVIRKLLALVGLLIVLAEDALGPGTGDQKKQRVKEDLQGQLPRLLEDSGVPPVLVALFTSDWLLDLVIESLVKAANEAGKLASAR